MNKTIIIFVSHFSFVHHLRTAFRNKFWSVERIKNIFFVRLLLWFRLEFKMKTLFYRIIAIVIEVFCSKMMIETIELNFLCTLMQVYIYTIYTYQYDVFSAKAFVFTLERHQEKYCVEWVLTNTYDLLMFVLNQSCSNLGQLDHVKH